MSDRILIWIDFETTGLNVKILPLEVALVATDYELNELSEPYVSAIVPTAGQLDIFQMDPYVVQMHSMNGLFEDVRRFGKTRDQVATDMAKWISDLPPSNEAHMLAGSTVGQFDRQILKIHWPNIHAVFHYRNVDVSSIKTLVEEWYGPHAAYSLSGEKAHRALGDVRESIAELKYYQETFFVESAIP